MMRLRGSSVQGQRGFTLIEVLIATALIGILTVTFTGFFIGMEKTNRSSNDRTFAVRNLDTAGNWLVLDFQSAQTVPPVTTLSPGSGSLAIYQSINGLGDSTVTYTINSNNELCRTSGANTARVAQNITGLTYVTGTASTPSTVTLTAAAGPDLMTKTYKIASRISYSNAELTILTRELPGGDVGVPYYQTITAYGGTMPYTYTVTSGSLPAWANASSLADSEIEGLQPTLGTYCFTIRVTDNAGNQVSQDYTIIINPAMSGVTPAAFPSGYIGVPYGPLLLAVSSGGTSPFYWSLGESSTLPAGLVLDLRSGIISGTPTAAPGVYNFNIVVTDSAGATLEASRSISISIPPPLAVATNAADHVGKYSATLHGYLAGLSNGSTAAVSFEYGLTTGYGFTAPGTPSPLSAVGAFSADIAGLTHKTTYHFRAKAVSNGSTVYGADYTFTTIP